MAELSETVLKIVAERQSVDSIDLANELNIDHQKVVGSIKSIQSLGDVSIMATWGEISRINKRLYISILPGIILLAVKCQCHC